MNKLPVGKTVINAYGFTFAHLGTIIGLVWVPLVVSTLLAILPRLAEKFGGAPDPSTAAIENLAVSLLTLLLYAVIYVAVTRQALGLRQGPAVFHFALGQAEFRVFGAVLLAVVGPVYFYAACLSVAAIVAVQGGAGSGALGVALVLAPAVVFVIVRLGFLVVPVTVNENQLQLARGWALTRGNFWRIFAVLLACGIPIYLLQMAGTFAVTGSDIAAVVPATGIQNPEALRHYLTALMDVFSRHSPALMFIDLILAPFSLGLSLSASAFAYRDLAVSSPSI